MHPDDDRHRAHWQLTHDVHDFLACAGDFLSSRPVLHTLPLTVTETLRTRGAQAYGGGEPVFGMLERAGEIRATFFRTPPRRLSLTSLTPEEAEGLAGRLADAGHTLPGVGGERDTAAAFAEAWTRHTGSTAPLHRRERLYRLGTPTPPGPRPEGRARLVVEADRDQLMRWYEDFAVSVGSGFPRDPGAWADARIAARRLTVWEAADGSPVAMAGLTPAVAGQVRVGPVYTPAPLRGRGYAGAATYEVSRAALAAGSTEVLLFTDLANETSNGLYQRIGYRAVAEFAVYDFVPAR